MPVPGVLPMVATLRAAGHGRVCVPLGNVEEARLVSGVEVVGAGGLDDVARLIAGPRGRKAASARRRSVVRVTRPDPAGGVAGAQGQDADGIDLADVRGQAAARWALEVAVAGRHNLLLVGPPGAGKTMLGRAARDLLPPLSDAEAQEVAVVRSVAGEAAMATARFQRPFLAPHHTTSYAAMVGGGPRLRPGLVTRAHHGTLFLDELAEFDRDVLDALRQPLEDGSVEVDRAHASERYPARLQLIAAMNPCRCGWFGDPERRCRCPRGEPARYMRRVSGPLVDRIDLRVVMTRLDPGQLVGGQDPEGSAIVAQRIGQAWSRAHARNGGYPNAVLRGRGLTRACGLGRAAGDILTEVSRRLELTARGVHRVLRVARTIADLRDHDAVGRDDILAATSLRDTSLEADDEA